jgi:hypothetical protein
MRIRLADRAISLRGGFGSSRPIYRLVGVSWESFRKLRDALALDSADGEILGRGRQLAARTGDRMAVVDQVFCPRASDDS